MYIECVTPANFELVLPLVAAYQSHFNVEPDEARNRAHFSQFLSDHSRGIQFIALDDGNALGFATLYFPFSSVRARVDCLMNDLFTLPAARRKGVGRALIQHCHQYAQKHGYQGLHWITAKENVSSQDFYAGTGAQRSEWYEYVLPA
jgi:GNAT superfamily N-acetyltransferase